MTFIKGFKGLNGVKEAPKPVNGTDVAAVPDALGERERPPSIRVKRGPKRQGSLTPVEKTLIAQVVQDQPAEIRPGQITALAKALRRSPAAVKSVVEQARQDFSGAAQTYVDIHLEATQKSLSSGDYETAAKAAQWAMTNIAHEGQRIVDKAETINHAPQILIGVKLGGLTTEPTMTALPVIDATVQTNG